MVIDIHAKNQVNVCKRLGKKSETLILWTDRLTDGRTDRQTDSWTECKPKVPFGFASRGLLKVRILRFKSTEQADDG